MPRIAKLSTFFVFLFSFLLFTACSKDEEEIDTCNDGFLSPGEEGIDCGGPCPPCEESDPVPMAYAEVNGQEIYFSNYFLERLDNWMLTFQNDSLVFRLNLGDEDTLGLRPIKEEGSFGETELNKYEVLAEGDVLFANINHDTKTISLFFNAKFTIDEESPNYSSLDTLFVREANFKYIQWHE